jgi:hypothetical protein
MSKDFFYCLLQIQLILQLTDTWIYPWGGNTGPPPGGWLVKTPPNPVTKVMVAYFFRGACREKRKKNALFITRVLFA